MWASRQRIVLPVYFDLVKRRRHGLYLFAGVLSLFVSEKKRIAGLIQIFQRLIPKSIRGEKRIRQGVGLDVNH